MLKTTKEIRFSLLILLLTNFLDWMSIGLVYPMFSSMLFHQGADFLPLATSDVVRGTWLGILLAAGPLAQFFSAPIVGALSDQKGRKPLLVQTLLVIIVGYFLCALGVWLHSLIFLLIGRLIVGIGTGNAAVVYAAIADISNADEKPKRFGLACMASGIGFTLGPFLGGAFSSWSFAAPFLFAMACSIVNLALLFFFLPETHHLRRKVELSISLGFKNLKKAFQIPALRALVLSVFFFCLGWSFYWEFIPVTWIQEYNLSPSEVGNFYAYGAAFYALSSGLLIRPVVNRFKPGAILFTALMLLALAILPLLIPSSVATFWIYIPVQQFLTALVFPTGTTIVSNAVSEDAQGEIMGILQSVDSFAFSFGPLVAGAFIGLSTKAPIIVSGALMLLAALVLPRSYRKSLFGPR